MKNKMTKAETWDRWIAHMKDKTANADAYIPWMEGGTKKSETVEGIFGVIFIVACATFPKWWGWLDMVVERILK